MTEKISLHALLFDLDGVLVDVSRSYLSAIEETVEHFTGRQVLPNMIERYKETGGFDDDWKLTHAIVTDTGMSIPFRQVMNEFQRRYRGEYWSGFIADEPPLVSGETLDLLSTDRVLGIVTTRPQDEALWTLTNFDWKRYFPLVVAREKHEGRFKPDPFALQHARAILDAAGRPVAAHECAYISDTVDGMTAGRRAEMWTIGVVPDHVEDRHTMADRLRAGGAHHVIYDSNELMDVVDRLHEFVAPEEPLESV